MGILFVGLPALGNGGLVDAWSLFLSFFPAAD
jgi:hypothetical protein